MSALELNPFVEANACTNCPTGKYGPLANDDTESTACKDCTTGKYNDQVGQTACKICDDGYYRDMGQCTKCSSDVERGLKLFLLIGVLGVLAGVVAWYLHLGLASLSRVYEMSTKVNS